MLAVIKLLTACCKYEIASYTLALSTTSADKAPVWPRTPRKRSAVLRASALPLQQARSLQRICLVLLGRHA